MLKSNILLILIIALYFSINKSKQTSYIAIPLGYKIVTINDIIQSNTLRDSYTSGSALKSQSNSLRNNLSQLVLLIKLLSQLKSLGNSPAIDYSSRLPVYNNRVRPVSRPSLRPQIPSYQLRPQQYYSYGERSSSPTLENLEDSPPEQSDDEVSGLLPINPNMIENYSGKLPINSRYQSKNQDQKVSRSLINNLPYEQSYDTKHIPVANKNSADNSPKVDSTSTVPAINLNPISTSTVKPIESGSVPQNDAPIVKTQIINTPETTSTISVQNVSPTEVTVKV